MSRDPSRHGRGAPHNPANRYHSTSEVVLDDGWGTADEPPPPLKTTVIPEKTRSIITRNNSPDVGFSQSINPYKGCEHGCVYCFARPTHAYLDLSPGLDFESKLFSKPQAAEVLRKQLRKKGYTPETIALGINTDAYQPTEREAGITREVLEVLEEFQHPVSIVTKSNLVLRDLDILSRMAANRLASVAVSITTLDRELARKMEPRAATPERRLDTIRHLAAAGVPVSALIAPIIPGLTDAELEAILQAVAEAGAATAGTILVRLPLEIKELFDGWLEEHYPLKKQHVLNLIRGTRGGKLYEAQFGTRMRGTGPYAELLRKRFEGAARRLGLDGEIPELCTSRFKPPPQAGDQLSLL